MHRAKGQKSKKESRQSLVKIHWRPSISLLSASLLILLIDFFFHFICFLNDRKIIVWRISEKEVLFFDKILNSFSLSSLSSYESDGEPLLSAKARNLNLSSENNVSRITERNE